MSADISQRLQQQVQQACNEKTPLIIAGGNTKSFLGDTDGLSTSSSKLDVSGHSGVLNYEPTELVITARAGTPLREIEQLLDDNGQMLPFEPPAFGDGATIGGTIACNLSGPRRAYAGAARDFMLGCKIINGRGEILSFGGEVMKNVAGYDVSRLMTGALGTLGVLLEVSLKILPRPEAENTRLFPCNATDALAKIHRWSQTPLPLSASSFHDSTLHLRLSGATDAVNAAIAAIGGENMPDPGPYWQRLKEQQLDFFVTEKPLWRLSLASDTKVTGIPNAADENDYLYEWGGALRWLKSDLPAETIRNTVADLDGHATLFRNRGRNSVFQPLTPGLMRIHQNLKQAFDPEKVLNPGRLYPEL